MRKTVSVLVVLGLVALCSSATADVRLDKAQSTKVLPKQVASAESSSLLMGSLRAGQTVIGGGGTSTGTRAIGDFCELDGTSAYCQMPPESGGGAGPDGIVLTASGSNYDDFLTIVADPDQQLSQFCWWGGYYDGAAPDPPPGPCDPIGEDFTLEIWDNVLGIPTNLVASWQESLFEITVTRDDTGVDLTFAGGASTIDIWEYTATVAAGTALTLADDTCYFLRIVNDLDNPDCTWYWRTADDDGATPFGNDWSTSGLWDQAFCINVECQLPGDTCMPTLPCEQPPANCQSPNGNWWIVGTTNTMVDNFKATATQPIVDICWNGGYVDSVPATPWDPSEDDFTVTFWLDTDTDGFPDTLDATYSQSGGSLAVLRAQEGVTALGDGSIESADFEFAGTLTPAYNVTAGNCYFMGIVNNGSSVQGSNYYMRTSTDGDGYLLVGRTTDPWDCNDLYDPSPYGPHDMPFCIDQALDPDPGSCVYLVVNDECIDAIDVVCNTQVNADNCLATAGLDDPQVLEESSDWSQCLLNPIFADNTMWYKWVATGDAITVKTCSTTGAADTVAGIFRLVQTTEPCTGNLVEAFAHSGGLPDFQTSSTRSCANPANHAFFCPGTLIQGETYYIMVGSDPGTAPGAFTLDIVCGAECEAPPTGACCQPDETCCPTPDDPGQRMTASQCFCDPVPPCTFGTAWFQDQACEDVVCPSSFCGEEGFCQFFSNVNAYYSDPDAANQGKGFDDFIPDITEPAQIVGMCFDGIWLTAVPCDPPAYNFEVGYYPDLGTGLPDIDNPIAVFSTADATLQVGGEDTGITFAPPDTTNIYQMTALHAAVPVEPGTCYWVSVSGLADDCVFLWTSSSDEFGGNGRKALWTPSGGLIMIGDEDNDGDFVFCIDLGLVPGSCPPPVGACCLQNPPSCVELQSEDECIDAGGIWRGVGMGCADVDCSVGACCVGLDCTQTDAAGCEGGVSVCDFATWGNEPVCFGDGNGDGVVNPTDVGLIKFYYPSDCSDPAFQEVCCRYDLDCDGSIGTGDVGLAKFFYSSGDPPACDASYPLHLAPPGDPNHCPLYFGGGGAGGSFYGYGTVCPAGRDNGEITCNCVCPDGALYECTEICDVEAAHDPPDPDCNGGCSEPGPPYEAFDPISAGDTICGTTAIVPALEPGYVNRDLDWFSFSTTDPNGTYVTWSVFSDFCAQIFIFEADCETGGGWVTDSLVQEVWPGECVNTVMDLCLPAGDWYAAVAPHWAGNNYALPCTMEDNRYYATLTFETPCPDGACCLAGACIETGTILECETAGGEVWYEGEDCFGTPPFECPLGVYCPAGSGLCDEYIAEVIVGTIDHLPDPGTGCGAGGYEDWTTISTNLTRGSSYNFDFRPGIIGYGIGWYYIGSELSVWIDYNADFDFDDAGENIGYQVPPPFDFDFIVDSGATVGETRLRVRWNYPDAGAPQPDPCGNTASGEVEDYTVNIQ
ncbi:MAG: hypothetical protein JSV78_14900 [Phycisphaerales bacterium]|nr:MAG: hypothetical protein JSV78_14900 [Phycisphaerales bacterium]